MLMKKIKKSDASQQKKVADEKEKELQECKDQLLRLRAEFENYKKQLDRRHCENVRSANASLIKELLDILDDFEKAIDSLKKGKCDEKIIQGIELIYKNFYKILEQRGLRKIDALGKKFDPYFHEVMIQEHSDKEDGTIIEELQKGYMLNGKILRHSKVKISKSQLGGN